MQTLPIHQQAEQLREQEKFTEALTLYEEVIIQYQKNQNYEGIAEALLGRFLTYKHLFLISNNDEFLKKGEQAIQESIAISKQHSIHSSLRTGYFSLGEFLVLQKKYAEAIPYYQQALAMITNEPWKGDYEYHLGEALFKDGQQEEGIEKMKQGLKSIRELPDDYDSFVRHVWESGCLMRLYECLKVDSPEEAKQYIEEAQKIIEKDPKLIIRKRQLLSLNELGS